MRKIVVKRQVHICGEWWPVGTVFEEVLDGLLYHERLDGHSASARVGDKFLGTKYENHLWNYPTDPELRIFKPFIANLENK